MRPLPSLALSALLLAPGLSRGEEGRLAAFEKGLANPPDPVAAPAASARKADDDDQDKDDEEGWSNTFGEVLVLSVLYGGMESLAAVSPGHWGVLEGIDFKREPGSTLVPYARVDSSYQSIDNNLDAVDLRGEVGFGPLGLQVRRTWYDEDNVDTGELQLTQVQFLYRMQYLGRLGVDLGVGPATLDGINRYDSVSWTTPVHLRLCDWFTAEFRPMWVTFDDSRVRDYELTGQVTWRNVGVYAGYRWLTNDDESLEAPLIGLSLRW